MVAVLFALSIAAAPAAPDASEGAGARVAGAPAERPSSYAPPGDRGGADSHWAFRRPCAAPPPEIAARDAAASPVDAFIIAELERRGMRTSPPADRRTLIRRATYDLTGLPPALEEVEAFLADPAPDAYERLIDRLLASPRHGERWARHWLDVARYADTKGYVYEDREEARFVHSATYRDWVIGALNDDLPYDRFLLEQIAGDQLRGEGDRRPLAAMGFLTVGRRFINNPHDIIDDRIDTLCRATMALTVGCARCHDHKFDPVPMADYYSLYGVFAGSTERMIAVDPDPPRAPEIEAYEAELRKREKDFRDYFETETEKLLEALRARTPAYLEAVLDVDRLPTEEFYFFIEGDELRPFIVRRWHSYILRFQEGVHPIFGPWHACAALPEDEVAARFPAWLERHRDGLDPRVRDALAAKPPSSMRDVAERYGEVFTRALGLWKEAEARGDAALPDPAAEELRRVLYGAHSPIAAPRGAFSEIEWFYAEKVRQEMGRKWRDIERWIIESDVAPPHAVYLADREVQKDPRVFQRGNPALPGESVPRRALRIIAGEEREPFARGSGRLELARSIAGASNPLTARVLVNRVWMHHFGEGIVATPSDFGLRGEPPSHPQLLDWLAVRFVEDGWSIKRLHRRLVLSSAYRRSSADIPGLRRKDPGNRLLWRMPRRRLEFEEMRDTFLAAAGRLDLRLGGPPVKLTEAPFPQQRSVYGFIDRLNIPSVFRSFDVAGPDQHAPKRHETTVPQQALFLLNGPFTIEQARALAARAGDGPPAERVRALYRAAFAREPSERELALGIEYAGARDEPPAEPRELPWRYGFGSVDEETGRVKGFTPLPHFTGSAWQGGPGLPDAALGWVTIDARGGHVGNDLEHMAIRRFVAPREMTVSVSGRLAHERTEGDGIRARVISSRAGTIATWTLHHGEVEATAGAFAVEAGEAIDFAVDCGDAGNITWDQFVWAPVVREAPAPGEAGAGAARGGALLEEWSASADFAGPSKPPLSTWERYAQALLLTNELLFLD